MQITKKHNLRKRKKEKPSDVAARLLHSTTYEGFDIPLIIAAQNNHLPVVAYLLSLHSHLNSRNISGFTPLLYAIANDNLPMVKLLLEKEANLKARTPIANSALHLSAFSTGGEIGALLLNKRINPILRNKNSSTALILAAQAQNFPLVFQLAKIGADVNSENRQGNSALMFAALSGDVAMLESLIACHADVNRANRKGETALHYAVKSPNPHVMVRRLLNAGGKMNVKDKCGRTALSYAAEREGSSMLIEEMKQNGAEMNSEDNEGRNLLMQKLMCQNITKEEIIFFRSLGVEVNRLDVKRQTALMLAVRNVENFEVIQFVKQEMGSDFDINHETNDGSTLLHFAVQQKRIEVIKWLLNEPKMDVNCQTKRGDSALHLLLKRVWSDCDISILQMMITAGANLHLRNNEGKSLLHLAAASRPVDLCQFLIFHGVEVNPKEEEDEINGGLSFSPLAVAVINNSTEVVKLLARSGADLNLRFGQSKHSLLNLAIMTSPPKVEMLELLLRLGVRNMGGNSILVQYTQDQFEWPLPRYLAGMLFLLELELEAGFEVENESVWKSAFCKSLKQRCDNIILENLFSTHSGVPIFPIINN